MHRPTHPLMPWPGHTERLADEEWVNPLMRWHSDAEKHGVRRGDAKVALLVLGASWYIDHVLDIPWQSSVPGPIAATGE